MNKTICNDNPCPECNEQLEVTESTNEWGIGTYHAFCNNCKWSHSGMLDEDE